MQREMAIPYRVWGEELKVNHRGEWFLILSAMGLFVCYFKSSVL